MPERRTQPRTIGTLTEELYDAMYHDDWERVQATVEELGEHAAELGAKATDGDDERIWIRFAEAEELSRAIPEATRRKLDKARFAYEIELGAKMTRALRIPDHEVAATLERTMRRLDERSEYEQMKEIVDYLIRDPAMGTIDDRRRVRTLRLGRVFPETPDAWRNGEERR